MSWCALMRSSVIQEAEQPFCRAGAVLDTLHQALASCFNKEANELESLEEKHKNDQALETMSYDEQFK